MMPSCTTSSLATTSTDLRGVSKAMLFYSVCSFNIMSAYLTEGALLGAFDAGLEDWREGAAEESRERGASSCTDTWGGFEPAPAPAPALTCISPDLHPSRANHLSWMPWVARMVARLMLVLPRRSSLPMSSSSTCRGCSSLPPYRLSFPPFSLSPPHLDDQLLPGVAPEVQGALELPLGVLVVPHLHSVKHMG